MMGVGKINELQRKTKDNTRIKPEFVFNKGGGPEKNYFFRSLLLLVVPWTIYILGPFFWETESMIAKTNFTLGPIKKSLCFVLL